MLENGYINTEESPAEESQFSRRHQPLQLPWQMEPHRSLMECNAEQECVYVCAGKLKYPNL